MGESPEALGRCGELSERFGCWPTCAHASAFFVALGAPSFAENDWTAELVDLSFVRRGDALLDATNRSVRGADAAVFLDPSSVPDLGRAAFATPLAPLCGSDFGGLFGFPKDARAAAAAAARRMCGGAFAGARADRAGPPNCLQDAVFFARRSVPETISATFRRIFGDPETDEFQALAKRRLLRFGDGRLPPRRRNRGGDRARRDGGLRLRIDERRKRLRARALRDPRQSALRDVPRLLRNALQLRAGPGRPAVAAPRRRDGRQGDAGAGPHLPRDDAPALGPLEFFVARDGRAPAERARSGFRTYGLRDDVSRFPMGHTRVVAGDAEFRDSSAGAIRVPTRRKYPRSGRRGARPASRPRRSSTRRSRRTGSTRQFRTGPAGARPFVGFKGAARALYSPRTRGERSTDTSRPRRGTSAT